LGDQGLAEKICIPDLDSEDRATDTKLAADNAAALLSCYRESDRDQGTRQHTFLELAWNIGARQGGLRVTELGSDSYFEFRHRPETRAPGSTRSEVAA